MEWSGVETMSIYQRAAYALGPALRQAGKALDALGASIEGSTAASDKCESELASRLGDGGGVGAILL